MVGNRHPMFLILTVQELNDRRKISQYYGAMVPYVTKSSIAMVLTLQDRQIHVYQEELLLTPFSSTTFTKQGVHHKK